MLADRSNSMLLLIDFQVRLMPAIHQSASVARRALLLAEAARRLDVPIIVTEQNSAGLGRTVPELAPYAAEPVEKKSFDACRDPRLLCLLPPERVVVVAGCEAHVCVLQTVVGLLAENRPVLAVSDAVGSRRPEDKAAGLARMAAHGAEIVTAEMVAFEWLGSSDDPAFRAIMPLIKES